MGQAQGREINRQVQEGRVSGYEFAESEVPKGCLGEDVFVSVGY